MPTNGPPATENDATFTHAQEEALQRAVSSMSKAARRAHWETSTPHNWNPTEPVIYFEETSFSGKPFRVPLVILRTDPCRAFVQGKCTMCNFMIEASRLPSHVGMEDVLRQVDFAIATLGDLGMLPYLVVTTAGSFFSNHEIDQECRLAILAKLRKAGLRRLSVESEPQYCVDLQVLGQCRREFGGDISVGIGIESFNRIIRNVCINKGLDSEVLRKACDLLTTSGYGYYFYLLVGKPFISQQVDLWDTIASIHESYARGAFMVVLRAINIQPFTMLHSLWKADHFTTPSLWIIPHVLRHLSPEAREGVTIKGVERDQTLPLAYATSCDLCRERLLSAFRKWNFTRDYSAFVDDVGSCGCCDIAEATPQPTTTAELLAMVSEKVAECSTLPAFVVQNVVSVI